MNHDIEQRLEELSAELQVALSDSNFSVAEQLEIEIDNIKKEQQNNEKC